MVERDLPKVETRVQFPLPAQAILATVFITGAAVLVIEVLAFRILSPYFGNTLFTASSVISVILAALSLGYYFGGKLADRQPSLIWFYGIVFLGGLSVLFLQILNLVILPVLGYNLPVTSGPLVSAVILFFLPAFLLGILSPFAVKLQKAEVPDEGIGTASGKVFFWSTLGSIFGSLLAGFVLIPNFGINKILTAIGLFLIAAGLLPLLKLNSFRKLSLFFIIGIAALLVISSVLIPSQEANLVYSEDGVYERITIYDGLIENRPARFLKQDRSRAGAMYLDSEGLAYEYLKYYSLYELFRSDLKEALVIGGGAYSVPKAILKEGPEVNIDVAEIEPELFKIAKLYFGVPDDPRLKNYVIDGRRFLHDVDKKYDLIFSDVYFSLYSVPTHFTTKEFFALAKGKLSEEGVFVANIIGDPSPKDPSSPSLLFAEMKTFQTIFPNSYFFVVSSGSSGPQNIIFLGANSSRKIDFESPEIKDSPNPIVRNLSSHIIKLEGVNWSAHPVLTDNFAPTDYLVAQMLRNARF